MSMIEIVSIVPALFALAVALWSMRRSREKIAALETDLDALENHSRVLVEQRDSAKGKLAEASAELYAATQRVDSVEAEKRELEEQRAAEVEKAVRLEKARIQAEAALAALRREHESLEHRVVDFQGQWSHQLSTLEAEISTLVRQLGEFRKGTTLPIARADPSSTSSKDGEAPSSTGPRLASG
jgi:chromosome segregation ATPase